MLDFIDGEKIMETVGLGFHFENIRIDYALTNLGNQSIGIYSNLFSLRYCFNE